MHLIDKIIFLFQKGLYVWSVKNPISILSNHAIQVRFKMERLFLVNVKRLII
jgi:hypothetical protein